MRLISRRKGNLIPLLHPMKIKLRCKDAKHKRSVISPKTRQTLYEYQKGRCFYCGNPFSNTYTAQTFFDKNIDHLWPFCYSFNDDIENLVLACSYCNSTKRDLLFDTVEEIIIYVRKNVSEKGIPLRRVFGCIRTKKIVAKVLLHEMSQQRILEDTPDYKNLTDAEIETRLEQLKLLEKILC